MKKSRFKELPSRKHFYNKLLLNFVLAFILIVISLSVGMLGYHYFMDLDFTDSLINASMILGGMGPVDHANSDGAKIFSSLYAIYCGVAFISSMALLFVPIVHRFLHKMHLEIESD